MREVILVQVVLQDPKVREVSLGPGGAKDKLAHVETLVLRVPAVIPSLYALRSLPLGSQGHVVTQDLWGHLVMQVRLELQDIKDQRVR